MWNNSTVPDSKRVGNALMLFFSLSVDAVATCYIPKTLTQYIEYHV